jgi:hypothetical protein
MKAKLFGLLPGARWVPHDIPAQDGPKSKSRNPFSSSKSRANDVHGGVRPRQSAISLTSEPDAELDARTHAQGQSMFFAMLPLELRKTVYEYVMGEDVVHLTMGSKKRFGHFLCGDGTEGKECACRVLVGGSVGVRLDGACVKMLVVCRRM